MAFTFDQHRNFIRTFVASAPGDQLYGTTLSITTGTASLFPATPFNCVVCPNGSMPTHLNAEVVRVQSIVGDSFIVTRAQEGSSRRVIQPGDVIYLAMTSKVFQDIEVAANTLDNTISSFLTVANGEATILLPTSFNSSVSVLGDASFMSLVGINNSAPKKTLDVNDTITNSLGTLIVEGYGTPESVTGQSLRVKGGDNLGDGFMAGGVLFAGKINAEDDNVLNSVEMYSGYQLSPNQISKIILKDPGNYQGSNIQLIAGQGSVNGVISLTAASNTMNVSSAGVTFNSGNVRFKTGKGFQWYNSETQLWHTKLCVGSQAQDGWDDGEV